LKAIASQVESDIGNVPKEGDRDVIVTAAPYVVPTRLAETAECPETIYRLRIAHSYQQRFYTSSDHTPRSVSIAIVLVDDLDALTREESAEGFPERKLTRENAQIKGCLPAERNRAVINRFLRYGVECRICE
jgi:hypothetical protein